MSIPSFNENHFLPVKALFTCLFFGFIGLSSFGQYLSVDQDTYSPQELIEDILINSGCIENVEVTNVVGANFGNGEMSYGYFERNNSTFPFEKGIVMSTGRLSNVPGPNDHLSDDNAAGWGGDADLENYLGIGNTTNATVLEFDFTPNANAIQFRYIFASEEYRENQATTCQYSDAFAFLIRPTSATQYENIAVIPGTDIPVKVTSVHPEIPGSCPAENEEYFGGYNGYESPIIFNGQTKILTAEANVEPGVSYHIKLVIADEINYRYDSAVFLEGESFNIGADLGEDISGLCEGDTYLLSPVGTGEEPENYEWYKVDGMGNDLLLAEGPDQDQYEVTESGTYRVVLTYSGNCTAEGEVKVEYVDFSYVQDLTVSSCIPSEVEPNGFIYNLTSYSNMFTLGNADFHVIGFYLNEEDALAGTNPIENPEEFNSEAPGQVIYVRVESDSGCMTTAALTLSIADTEEFGLDLYACPDSEEATSYSFNLNESVAIIQDELGIYIDFLEYYETSEDAFHQENALSAQYSLSYEELPKTVYARIDGSLGCQGLVAITLNGLEPPMIDPGYRPDAFCEGSDENIILQSGVEGNEEDYTYLWENGATTPTIEVSEAGTYEVIISKEYSVGDDIFSCSITNTLTVEESEIPEVSYELVGEPGNYEVNLYASGSGHYVFALDNQIYSPISNYKVGAGKHTYYVKDLNGCGAVKGEFYVVDYMKFFTPNGDGINDTWKILGDNLRDPQVKRVMIFNRYGKLIITLSNTYSWDGTHQGRPLPSDDYWFKIEFKNGDTFKSHFSLIR